VISTVSVAFDGSNQLLPFITLASHPMHSTALLASYYHTAKLLTTEGKASQQGGFNSFFPFNRG
jgi:hypothetical protein